MTVEMDIKAPVHELLASPSGAPPDSARIPSTRSRAHVPRTAPTDEAFSAVFDSSAEALVLIDPAGTIQQANSRARQLLRLQAGKHRMGLGDVFSGAHSSELSEFWTRPAEPLPRSIDAHLGSGASLRVTLRAVIPGTGHLLLCIEEGSVVQRAELRWRQVESELRGILESIQAAILVYSASGEIRFSNARFGELLGLDLREMRKLRSFDELNELIGPRFRRPGSFAAPWRSFTETGGEPGHDELEITRPSRRVIERFFRPILDGEGRGIGWLERYLDITGDRQIQSQMLQTEKMAALGQLVSGIAHELNNPLTAIMGYAQLLLGKGLTPAQHPEAERVFREAERARRIVKNLLYFARENRAERTRVELNEIIERTLALRSYELRVEDIAVECDLAPHLPATLADPYQLQQVILNLLVNAEQALLEGRGRGHVWIRTRHIIQGVAKKVRDRIVLEVADDGPGIPPEIASRVFDPFFTSKPSGVGTGLGLSIVYGIVHQHGGEVAFDNRPGGGARFFVDLPVVDASGESRSAVESASRELAAAEESTPIAPARILAVEDEPTVAQLIVDVLREEGHRVEAVLDGQEALRRLTRNPYDLVICDLRMPHFDGEAVYQSLRHAGSPLLKRILFITGDVIAPQTREFLEPNQLPYLAKPFLVEELKLAVNRLLDPREGDQTKADSAAAAGDSGGKSIAPESSRTERKTK
jgi:signal transduction histidine kinase/DNA-binding NarL/FixJ family response regulator